ncbi:MAG: hypothetical protein JO125_05160 [Chloroflexi bacterium]|nr:hypothetical protein [Ktedonobacteraceae bacterium]MBV8822700.1 hypothetical protein [Ktedonobacteraceae bacterium]MBV9019324.1 hypothetical protein [Ktedonobacteraceae bacterium]MBV9706774.1 hypothetical protein [Chloroflexota bacterium]
MGVERPVTQWYVQRQRILGEIALLEAAFTQAKAEQDGDATVLEHTAQQLIKAQKKLHALGPCPKPMMG